jgi:hypothetical protein
MLGVKLLRLQRLKSLEERGQAIAAIGSKAATAEKGSAYAADIFVELEELARAADAGGHLQIAQKFRLEIAKPKGMSEQAVAEYSEAIQRRVEELDEGEFGHPLPGFGLD